MDFPSFNYTSTFHVDGPAASALPGGSFWSFVASWTQRAVKESTVQSGQQGFEFWFCPVNPGISRVPLHLAKLRFPPL